MSVVINTTDETIMFWIKVSESEMTRYITQPGQGIDSNAYPEAARELERMVKDSTEDYDDLEMK